MRRDNRVTTTKTGPGSYLHGEVNLSVPGIISNNTIHTIQCKMISDIKYYQISNNIKYQTNDIKQKARIIFAHRGQPERALNNMIRSLFIAAVAQ